jgi:L-ascorbate metabolism protein UlaG (beta-lactamase superfamily)
VARCDDYLRGDSVKIRFYAHASFRLEVDAFAVITDPYTPGPQNSGFDPIDELADVVIMSSATDPFHSDPSHVRGDPTVVNALELPPEGAEARGLHVRPFPAMESMTFDFGRDPDANAMYLFTLGGVLHMGDIGIPISREHLDALHGKVDLLFALAGAHATIALDDLDAAIDAIGPRRHPDALLQRTRRARHRAGRHLPRTPPRRFRNVGQWVGARADARVAAREGAAHLHAGTVALN